MRSHPILMFGLGFGSYWALQHFTGFGISGRGKVS
jgi:hypothetical protein